MDTNTNPADYTGNPSMTLAINPALLHAERALVNALPDRNITCTAIHPDHLALDIDGNKFLVYSDRYDARSHGQNHLDVDGVVLTINNLPAASVKVFVGNLGWVGTIPSTEVDALLSGLDANDREQVQVFPNVISMDMIPPHRRGIDGPFLLAVDRQGAGVDSMEFTTCANLVELIAEGRRENLFPTFTYIYHSDLVTPTEIDERFELPESYPLKDAVDPTLTRAERGTI